jgi:hypothetical protein
LKISVTGKWDSDSNVACFAEEKIKKMSEMRYGTFNALEKLKRNCRAEYDHDRATVFVCVWDGLEAAVAIAVFRLWKKQARRKEADVRVS